MKSRILSACLAIGVLAFGSAGAYAAVGHVSAAGKTHHAAKHKAKKAKRHHARHHRRAHHAAAGSRATAAPAVSAPAASAAPAAAADARSAAAQEYGTRPGKGCGDKNHQHTGPPGNPGNTDCPHGQ